MTERRHELDHVRPIAPTAENADRFTDWGDRRNDIVDAASWDLDRPEPTTAVTRRKTAAPAPQGRIDRVADAAARVPILREAGSIIVRSFAFALALTALYKVWLIFREAIIVGLVFVALVTIAVLGDALGRSGRGRKGRGGPPCCGC